MPRPERIDDVFERMQTRRGSFRCRVCRAVVPPPPADELEFFWWPGRKHLFGHPWDCSKCERAFITPGGLSKHQRAIHPAAPQNPGL